MFATECVDEDERLGKLTGFDQEASAIDFPWRGVFFHNPLPFEERRKDIRYATAAFSFSL